jgi:hypothetical protein
MDKFDTILQRLVESSPRSGVTISSENNDKQSNITFVSRCFAFSYDSSLNSNSVIV